MSDNRDCKSCEYSDEDWDLNGKTVCWLLSEDEVAYAENWEYEPCDAWRERGAKA